MVKVHVNNLIQQYDSSCERGRQRGRSQSLSTPSLPSMPFLLFRSLGAGAATACRRQMSGRVRFGAWVLVALQGATAMCGRVHLELGCCCPSSCTLWREVHGCQPFQMRMPACVLERGCWCRCGHRAVHKSFLLSGVCAGAILL